MCGSQRGSWSVLEHRQDRAEGRELAWRVRAQRAAWLAVGTVGSGESLGRYGALPAAPGRSLRFQVASMAAHGTATTLQQSVPLAAQPLLNKCPEEEHSTICFLVFGSAPCLQKAACVWFPSPQSRHGAFPRLAVQLGSSPACHCPGMVMTIALASPLPPLPRQDTAIPSPFLEGLSWPTQPLMCKWTIFCFKGR